MSGQGQEVDSLRGHADSGAFLSADVLRKQTFLCEDTCMATDQKSFFDKGVLRQILRMTPVDSTIADFGIQN